jgi:hypothetical protein
MKKYTNKILIIAISCLTILLINLVIKNKIYFGTKHSVILTADLNKVKSVEFNGNRELQLKQGVIESGIKLPPDAYIEDSKLYLVLKGDEQVIKLTLPELEEIHISGAAKVTLDNFKQKDIKVKLAGASNFIIINSNFSNVNLSSAGDSQLIFKDCRLKNLNVNLTGSSNIIINSFANGSLTGMAAGNVNITYSGNLIDNKLKIFGNSNISRINK